MAKWIVEYSHTKWAEFEIEAKTAEEAEKKADDIIATRIIEDSDIVCDEGWELRAILEKENSK